MRSHMAPDPDPMDEHNTAWVQGSMGNSSGKVIPSGNTVPNNLNQASSNNEEPEIQIKPLLMITQMIKTRKSRRMMKVALLNRPQCLLSYLTLRP